MPRLSAWFVRASLLYLLSGFTLGALLLAHKGVPYSMRLWQLLPAHMEFLLVGWLGQLAMGVAYWILPRFGRGAPRGNVRLIVAAFVLLNAGILLVAIQQVSAVLLLAGRGLELAGAAAYVAGSWWRVKPVVIGTETRSGT